MKKLCYIIVILLISNSVKAQDNPSPVAPCVGSMAGESCTIALYILQRANCKLIWFCYDASGNRIARYVPVCSPLITTGGGGGGPYAMAAAPINTELIDTNSTIAVIEATMLFPNPTMGVTNIVFPKEMTNVSIILLDMNGKILETKIFSGKETFIDLTQLAGGTYYIVISSDAENVKKAIIKQ
jgi:hypothetical protein